MSKNSKKHHKRAIRMIEEAVHILRAAPGALLTFYYVGSVPFVLGLLYFWADMSRSANAHQYSAMAAMGLSFLFIWMKFWQTVYMLRVRAHIFGEIRLQWTLPRVVSIVATQSLVQATRIFVLPLASLMVVPYGFCYAFYQNVSVYEKAQGQTLSSACKWAWYQARLWPRQNHLLIGIYWLVGVVIFVNVSISVIFIPQMVKTLFGIDSAFTISGIYMVLNTTFWIVVLGITYLLLDPFIKATYVLRCFYGSALQSGEDLKTELGQILADKKKMVAGFLIVSLCVSPFSSFAVQKEPVTAVELDRSIEETMGRREFTWRMPREVNEMEEKENKGPLAAAVDWLVEMVGKGLNKIGDWITKLIKWLGSLLPKPDQKTESANGSWIAPVRMVLLILIILLLAVLTFIFVRIWRRHRSGVVESVDAVAAPIPDLADESVTADDVSTNRWLTMAGELADKGEFRLAMRALYLATLAHLADHDMITIEEYKSNREYERELKRRAHEHKELISIFSTSLNFFECVWYGMYRIARSDFDVFATNHRRIMAFAEK